MQPPNPDASLPPDQLRDIPNYARSYALNRSLPVLVLLTVMALTYAGLGFFAQLTGVAFRAGRTLVFCLSAAVTAICLAGTIAFAFPRVWKWFQGPLIRWLYRNDGSVLVSPATPCARSSRSPWMYAISAPLVLCAIALVALIPRIGERYEQPLVALFGVPVMIAIGVLARPAGSLMLGLWASLYALHAVLILAGAPILIQGQWSWLNVSLPMFGYGILSALVSHLYSQAALRRLQRLGASEERV